MQPTTLKTKNSSVARAPAASAINRPASAVATAARKAGQRGGASAVGVGEVATATSSCGPAWWVYLAVLGAVG
jgi:2-keto-4-pentenoate hydratase